MNGTILQPVFPPDKPHWGCSRSLWLQGPSQLRAWGLRRFALCLQNLRQPEELPAPGMGLMDEQRWSERERDVLPAEECAESVCSSKVRSVWGEHPDRALLAAERPDLHRSFSKAIKVTTTNK